MTLIIVTILQNSIAFNAVQVQQAQNLSIYLLSEMNRFQIFVGIKRTFLHSKLHVPVQLSNSGMSCTRSNQIHVHKLVPILGQLIKCW